MISEYYRQTCVSGSDKIPFSEPGQFIMLAMTYRS